MGLYSLFLNFAKNTLFMHKVRHYLFLSAIVFLPSGLFAQAPVSGTIEKSADVNFLELADYCKTHPTPNVRKPFYDEGDEEASKPYHRPAVGSMVKMYQRDAIHGAETPHTAYLPVSNAPADTFLATPSDGTSIPPDTHGSVDSTYCVTAINDSVVIRLRNGSHVSGVTLDAFWATEEPHGPGAYDPRVHYDPNFKRWIMVTDCYGQSANSQIMIAVSATGNPTGTWHKYKLVVGTTSGTWLDFPCVGFNNRWVAVSGNFFNSGGSFTNDVIYVFNYANLMSGGALSYTTLLPTGGSFCIAPALTYDAAAPNLYCMENWNGTSGQLKLYKISGTTAAPTLSSVANPATSTHWKSNGNSGNDFAPQVGVTNKLQTNDDRINNLCQRNGKLWCAYNAFFPATGTVTRCSAMWWEVDTLGTVNQVGKVDDPTNATFYAFPSIAVNNNGDALMGFAYLSTTLHPSAGYAMHMASDPADSMRPPVIFRHGQKSYYQTFGGSQDRWGDYSSTCIDPRNNLDFWTIQESVPNYSGSISNSVWDTWWAYVQVCQLSAVPSYSISTHTTYVGTNVTFTYTGTVLAGAAYNWNFAGGTATPGGTTAGPQVVSWSAPGLYTVTLTLTNGGCSSVTFTDTIRVLAGVGVPQVAGGNMTISVLPNPNDGNFDILFNKPLNDVVTVKLIDMQGREVYSNQFAGSGNDKLNIATNGLAAGVYAVSVITGGEVSTSKITISR